MKKARAFAALLFVTALTGCGDDVLEPSGPGLLNVSLTTPNTDDGAILFTVSGAQIDSVQSAGYTTYSAHLSATSAWIMVVGDVKSGLVASIWVPDLAASAEYATRIRQAAALGSYEQQDLGGYSLQVVEP